MTSPVRPSARIGILRLALETVLVCAFAAMVVVAVDGATRVVLPGMVLRLGAVGGLAVAGAVALLGRIALGIWCTPRPMWPRETLVTTFRLTVLTILGSDLGLVLGHLVTSCGGLDSAGYIGSARLFLSFHLTHYEPIARLLPFDNATAATAPFGFVPAATPYFIAPRFPPGLPLVIAASIAAGGRSAPFFLAPSFGIGVLALVYVITRRFADWTTAALAAVFAGATPIFLDLALQPMSDVPATFWIVLAAFFIWRDEPRPVLGAMAAGMAVLTRPPLALAGVALLLVTSWRNRRQAIVFAGLLGAVVIVFLALQSHLYGHALMSGYGSLGELFTLGSLRRNVVAYGKWMLVTHTPVAVVLFVAGAVENPRLALRAGAIFLATAAPYLIYAPPFEDWEILRFLLPGLPLVLAVCAVGVFRLAKAPRHPVRAVSAATVVAIAAAGGSYTFLQARHVFHLPAQEMRYQLVGEWFAGHAPPNAVAIAELHSGSLRIYSDRTTLRMTSLPEGSLVETVQALQRGGYVAYAVIEQGEEYEDFQRRFHPDTERALSIAPEARIRGVNVFRLEVR
jgi:hypothetical protein